VENENKTQPPKIETLSGDMLDILKTNKEGLVKKIIEEEEKHDEDKRLYSPESTQNKIFIYVGGIFLIAGIVALLFLFFKKDFGIVSVKPQFSPIIFTDSNVLSEVKGLTDEKVIDAILDKVAISEVKEGGVEGIYLTKGGKVIGLTDFMESVGASLSIKKEDFFEENYLLGFKDADKRYPFILIKMRSLYDVYPEVREWERKIFLELSSLWGVELSSDTAYLLTKNFEDGIAQNKNARILYDNSGGIVIMYVYIDDNTILVTNSEVATKEVIQRLAGSRVKK
jgi:hypothetical protein